MRVRLQAPGHGAGLLLQLNSCRHSRRYCDVLLHVGGRSFAAHRAVLACAGEYFRNLFGRGLATPGAAPGPAFSLEFISAANFEKVLTFVYTGEMVTDLMDVGALYELAGRLGVGELVRACHATFPDLRTAGSGGGGATAALSICSSVPSCRSLSPPAAVPSTPFPAGNAGLDSEAGVLDLKTEDLLCHAPPPGGPPGPGGGALPSSAALQPKVEEGLENSEAAGDKDDPMDSLSLPDSSAPLAAEASSSGPQVAMLDGEVGGAALEEEQWGRLAVDVIELSDDERFLEEEEDDLLCIENGDVTNSQVSLFCKACTAPLSANAAAIRTHAQSHVTDRGHCKLCGAAFPDRAAAGPHALSHVGVRLFTCDMCHLQFCSQNKLLQHHHQAASSYVLPQGALPAQGSSSELQCAVCSQTLSKDFQTIKDHLLSHVSGQTLTCSVCQLPQPSLCSLLWHFLLHLALPVFCCPHCARCFAERPLLDRHVSVHDTETKEELHCFLCPLMFRSSSAFQYHLSLHAPEPLGSGGGDGVQGWLGKRKAEQPLDRSFSSSPRDGPLKMSSLGSAAGFFQGPLPGLTSGVLADSQDGGAGVRSKWYRCRYCGKRFAHSGEFTYHLRIHTGEKPYQCKVCLRFFRGRSTMICHLKTHAGALMYRCTVCGLFFSTLKMVSSHMELHQDQLPPDFNIEQTFMYNDHSKEPLAAVDT